MPFENPSDQKIDDLLAAARTFLVVGASPNPARPSYGVMERLLARGYTVIPVNPGHAGGEILGQTVYGRIEDVPGPADIVDIFRTSDAALQVTQTAVAEKDRLGLKAIWMQIGVVNPQAARLACEAGLMVIMDRCPKIELQRSDRL